MEQYNLVDIFKALGDKTRIEIVDILKHKEICVCVLLESFTCSQPALSHHLKILKQAKIVIDRREGKWIHYRLNSDVIDVVKKFIDNKIKS